MLSPAENPRVQRQKLCKQHDETSNKENATSNPVRSPRVVFNNSVLRCSKPLTNSAARGLSLLVQEDLDTVETHVPTESDDVLPRKRRLYDIVESSADVTNGDERPNKRGTRDCSRVNPFDAPLKQVPQTAAPIRSYRLKPKAVCVKAVMDPPPRMLVSYSDLWEGVSSIRKDEIEDEHHDDYGHCAMYDFLYDGVWTRSVGRLVVPIEKVFKDPVWSSAFPFPSWSLRASRRRRFRDLDRPVSLSPF